MTIDELKKTIHKLGLLIDDSNGQILIDWDKIPFFEEDRPYWAILSSIEGIGPSTLAILIAAFGSAREVFEQTENSLSSVGLSKKVMDKIFKFKKIDFKEYFKRLSITDGHNLFFVTPGENFFPSLLSKISHGPSQLWVWGNQKTLLARYPIAVVGTRKITAYGREITIHLTKQLAARGCAIVSGLMYGVDETAMRAALNVGGLVIGVWAGGLSRQSLSSRWQLARDIVDKGGVVVSEFCINQFPEKGLFPIRNRIVSGLSKLVIVTEGAVKSGSLITARCAIEQGKPVFAVPGPITSDFSAGPNELLKLGAQPLTSSQDIFDYLDIKKDSISADKSQFFSYQPQNETEKIILHLLSEIPFSTDELVRRSGFQPSKLSEILVNLEMLNVISQSDGEWKIKNQA